MGSARGPEGALRPRRPPPKGGMLPPVVSEICRVGPASLLPCCLFPVRISPAIETQAFLVITLPQTELLGPVGDV